MMVMVTDALRSPSPTTPTQTELNAMLDRRAELAAVAANAERRQGGRSGSRRPMR
jgi:hypothetical protein